MFVTSLIDSIAIYIDNVLIVLFSWLKIFCAKSILKFSF